MVVKLLLKIGNEYHDVGNAQLSEISSFLHQICRVEYPVVYGAKNHINVAFLLSDKAIESLHDFEDDLATIEKIEGGVLSNRLIEKYAEKFEAEKFGKKGLGLMKKILIVGAVPREVRVVVRAKKDEGDQLEKVWGPLKRSA